MSRVVAKTVIGNYRYVGLYCNTVDEMLSPMFISRVEFRDWVRNQYGREKDCWAYWDSEAFDWLANGPVGEWVLRNEAEEYIMWEE